jgi:hypothetical protein
MSPNGRPATLEAELIAKDLETRLFMLEKIRAEDKPLLDVEVVEPAKDKLKLELELVEKDAWRGAEPEKALGPKFEGAPRLADVRTERVSDATARALLAEAGVAVGDSISEDTAKRIQLVAVAMDEHFRVEFQKDRKGELVITILAR